MSRFKSSAAGKGPDSRVSNYSAYWSSPLWDNVGKNKSENQTNESSKFKALFLDDDRIPEVAYMWDEGKTLQQFSGINNDKWDIVRSYDEFVDYIEKNGIPTVVSFDNDLWTPKWDELSEEESLKIFQMIDWENSDIKTGAHCAAWLCERCKALQHPLPKYYVHSANAAARPIIKGIMESARPFIKH